MITLVIGSDAVGSDGYRGEVLAAVVDPAARTVTHLVVEPEGRQGLARLVPLDLVEAGPDLVRLGCTEAEFKNLSAAEETLAEFVPGYPDPVQLLSPGWRGADEPTVDGGAIPRIPEQETIDVIPPGEVEEHRGEHVHATDGDIGHLRALRIDPGSRQVTHVLIREGPVWDRKDVAIPAALVAGFDDGIRLSITRQQVRDLPQASIDHPVGSVNVGMPKDVSWRGRTVHTGVWKSPVSGPQMVRRLNIDGDGQGDRPGTVASSAPCSSTRSSPIGTGRSIFGANDMEPRCLRGELHGRGPRRRRRSASVTDTGSVRRSSRSPSRG